MIIGLTGRSGHGKGVAGDVLIEKGMVSLAFAEPIKIFFADLLNVPLAKLEDREFVKLPQPLLGGKTLRECYQSIGNDWGRDLIDSDLWVNRCIAHYDELLKSSDVVFTDVRYDNEAQMIRSRGGIIIKSIGVNVKDPIDKELDSNDSEKGISDHLVDFTVVNDQSLGLESFRGVIEDLLYQLRFDDLIREAGQ